eukprot:scaffold7225_cov379-Prasinococcus_capsulatus_cf.AAC.3
MPSALSRAAFCACYWLGAPVPPLAAMRGSPGQARHGSPLRHGVYSRSEIGVTDPPWGAEEPVTGARPASGAQPTETTVAGRLARCRRWGPAAAPPGGRS